MAGSDEQRERWLPGLASGELRGTVGLLKGGEARLVPDAAEADLIVLAGDDGGGRGRASALPRSSRSRRSTRPAASPACARTAATRCPGDVQPAIDRISAALAAENVGVAQRAMEMAVDYARERKQFDRPIGAYQAVSHRCAQMLLEVEGSRSAAYYAAWCADAEPETLAQAASMAKAYASDAGWRVCTSSLQVHGGIGFTWEHDLHFFLKRARTNGLMFGSATEHRERVASLVGLSSDLSVA